MLAHLAALLGAYMPFGNILGPLVVWLVKRDDSPEIDRAGKEALNFQISVTIFLVVGLLLFFVTIFSVSFTRYATFVFAPLAVWGLCFLLMLFDLVFIVIAAVKTQQGKDFHYPLAFPFLR